jgi:hypothetical protein
MLINTKQLINEIIKEDLETKINTNPLKMKDILDEVTIKDRETVLQQCVSQISKDPTYYSYFKEAVLPNQAQQPTPTPTPQAQSQATQEQAKQTQVAAKAKTLQDQLANVQKQQGEQGLNPVKQKSLEEKKLEIQAALEKLRIDSDERVANARIASDDKHGTKRTIVSAVSGGVGASVLPAAIGGAMMIPWKDVGGGLLKAGTWAAKKAMGA